MSARSGGNRICGAAGKANNTMDEVGFVVLEPPVPKERARKGAYGNFYNPQRQEEEIFQWSVKKQLPRGFRPFERGVPLLLECTFFLPIPGSRSKKQQDLMDAQIVKPTDVPDLDNCTKFVKDCLNHLVWDDDRQVVKEITSKEYSRMPRTEVIIKKAA